MQQKKHTDLDRPEQPDHLTAEEQRRTLIAEYAGLLNWQQKRMYRDASDWERAVLDIAIAGANAALMAAADQLEEMGRELAAADAAQGS